MNPRLLPVALAAALALGPAPAGEAPLPAATQLDLDRYAGRWYEIARLPMPYEDDCTGDVRAEYARRPDGGIEVINRCRTAAGESIARGSARVLGPGRLQVRFAPDWLAWLPWVWADYQVIELDPQYRWALVGQPSRRYLWVLARTPQLDAAVTEGLLARARELGFDLTELIRTPQDGG